MDEHLAALETPAPEDRAVWYPAAEKAALAIRSLVVDGGEPPPSRLAEVFEQLTDDALLEPVAEALLVGWLVYQRMDLLETVLQSGSHAAYLWRAVPAAQAAGLELLPLLPLAARYWSRDARLALTLAVEVQPPLVSAVLQHVPPAREDEFLQELAFYRGQPLDAALTRLLSKLESADLRVRRETARTLRAAAESGTDLLDAEIPFLLQGDPKVRHDLAYAMALSAATHQDWNAVDRLLQAPSLERRTGALQAVGVAWVDLGRDLIPLATRVCRALTDSSGEVADQAEALFFRARRKGRRARPERETLLSLGPGQAAPLYWLVVDRPDLAAELAPRLPEGVLRQACEEIAEGTHRAPCELCRNLDRVVEVTHQSLLPPEFPLFGIEPEAEAAETQCPSCGHPYDYSYSRQYDDMTLDETFTLARRRPQPDLTRLQHPDPRIRGEAAWSVGSELAEARDWAGLARQLLAHPCPAVRDEALRLVEDPLPLELVEPVQGCLQHSRARALLSRHYALREDYRTLSELVERFTPEEQIELLAGLPDQALEHFHEVALALLERPAVADRAVSLLMRSERVEPILDVIERLWTGPAARLWSHLAKQRKPVERLAPQAAARLGDRECASATVQGLEALARRGVPLAFAIAPLCQVLERGACPDLRAASWILKQELDRQPPDESTLAALGRLAARPDQAREASGRLYDAVLRGQDVTPALPGLRQAAAFANGLAHEFAVRALTRHWAARQQWPALADLLVSRPGLTCGELADMAGNLDWSPLLTLVESYAASEVEPDWRQAEKFYNHSQAQKALDAYRARETRR